jgi:NADH-quinone oxidoreductase subunit L
MNPENILFLNFSIFLLGFGVLFVLKKSLISAVIDWLVISIFSLGIILISSLSEFVSGNSVYKLDWFSIGEARFDFEILLDSKAYFMAVLIQIIALLVILFSSKYLRSDSGRSRFYAYIMLFVFSMLGVVLSGNLFQLYIFWELVGFTSFLLIGFWFTEKENNKAAFKAFMVNRFGDVFLLLGIVLVLYKQETLSFLDFDAVDFSREGRYYFWTGLLLFMGVISKSAQLPLQVWLPRAMTGPTPASALIHAATMVVSGVFLLARVLPLLPESVRVIISAVGAFTALFAAFSALFQNKLKAVLAYSTISQLGYMVSGMGLGAVGPALFHLSTHAFFKAGLFLCAGAIIEFYHHEQDIKKMGGLQKIKPLWFLCFAVCGLSLTGLPLTSGFLSKESIIIASLDLMKGNYYSFRLAIPILLILSSFITALYFLRVLIMVFFERQESQVQKFIDNTKKTLDATKKSFENILSGEKQESTNNPYIESLKTAGVYEISMLLLALGSLFFIFSPNALSLDQVWFLKEFSGVNGHYPWLPWLMMTLLFAAVLISYNTTYEEIYSYYFEKKPSKWKTRFINLGKENFFIEHLYSRIFRKGIFKFDSDKSHKNQMGYALKVVLFIELALNRSIEFLVKNFIDFGSFIGKIDEWVFDKGVNGLAKTVLNLGSKLKKTQSISPQSYLWVGICGLFFYLIIQSLV